MPARGSPGVAVPAIEIGVLDGGGGGQFRSGGETHDADFVRIEIPLFGIGAHQADGLQRVVDLIRLRVVAIAAETVAEDDSVDAVVVKEGDEIGGFGTDVESVVAAAGRQNDGGAGVEATVDRMKFDGRIVNVDDVGDAPGHRLAHVVLLGLADACGFQVGGIGREQGHHHAAGHDGLRRVRGGGLGAGLGNAEGRGQRREGGLRRGCAGRSKQEKQAELHRMDYTTGD